MGRLLRGNDRQLRRTFAALGGVWVWATLAGGMVSAVEYDGLPTDDYLGEVEIQDTQKAATFDGFEKIKAQDYFDLTGSYQINDMVGLTVGVRNLFEQDLPIVGNEAGSTDANSGNTFPSTYDVFGRTYTIGLKATF